MLLAYIALNYNKSASHFDLHLNEGRLRTKNVFNFFILKFQFICKKKIQYQLHMGRSVSVYQLMRYSKAFVSFQKFIERGLLKTRKQGF